MVCDCRDLLHEVFKNVAWLNKVSQIICMLASLTPIRNMGAISFTPDSIFTRHIVPVLSILLGKAMADDANLLMEIQCFAPPPFMGKDSFSGYQLLRSVVNWLEVRPISSSPSPFQRFNDHLLCV